MVTASSGGGFSAFPRGGIFSPDEHPRLCWILLDTANEACCNNAELVVMVVMFSGYYCHFGHGPHHCHHNAVTNTTTTSQGALNMTLVDNHFPSLILLGSKVIYYSYTEDRGKPSNHQS